MLDKDELQREIVPLKYFPFQAEYLLSSEKCMLGRYNSLSISTPAYTVT